MRTIRALALYLAAVLTLPCARAAIFVSDLGATRSGTSLTLRFVLNEDAASGHILVARLSAPDTPVLSLPLNESQRKRGTQTISLSTNAFLPGEYIFQVRVSAVARSQWSLIGSVQRLPEGVRTGIGSPVNRQAGTHGYGHLFVADPTRHVLHEYNAAGEAVQTITVNPFGAGSLVPYAVAIGPDGSLYASDQDIDALYVISASGTSFKPNWAISSTLTGPLDSLDARAGTLKTRGFQVLGDRIILTNYSSPSGVDAVLLGDPAQAPLRLFPVPSLADGRADQVLASWDGSSIYVSTGAHPSAEGSRLNRYILSGGSWVLDPAFAQNDPARAVVKGRVRGMAFSAEGHLLAAVNGGAASGSEDNYLLLLAVTGTPRNPAASARALRLSGGLPEPQALPDTDSDGRITITDSLASLRNPLEAGMELHRIPAPLYGFPLLPVLPVSLDLDPAGNIVVVAAPNSESGLTGSLFYMMAPPDHGSSHTGASAAFRL